MTNTYHLELTNGETGELAGYGFTDVHIVPTVFEFTDKNENGLINNTLVDVKLVDFEQTTNTSGTLLSMIILIDSHEQLEFFSKLMSSTSRGLINFDLNNKFYFAGLSVNQLSIEYSRNYLENGLPTGMKIIMCDHRKWRAEIATNAEIIEPVEKIAS